MKSWRKLVGGLALCGFLLACLVWLADLRLPPVSQDDANVSASPSAAGVSENAGVEPSDFADPSSPADNVSGGGSQSAPEADKALAESQLRYDRFYQAGLKPGYENVVAAFSEQDLPFLYQVLSDEEYLYRWPAAVHILGYLGTEDETVPFLIEFIERPEVEVRYYREPFTAKRRALEALGLIGGPQAESVLRKALDLEGIRELGAKWLNAPALDEDRGVFIGAMRADAARGLVYTQKPENLRLVEEVYLQARELALPIKDRTYESYGGDEQALQEDYVLYTQFGSLTEVMAMRDLIEEIGMEAFKPLIYDGPAHYYAIAPYWDKYRLD